jgi:hypothetical protein
MFLATGNYNVACLALGTLNGDASIVLKVCFNRWHPVGRIAT